MYKYKETSTIDKIIKKIENAIFYSEFKISLVKAAIRLTEFDREEN